MNIENSIDEGLKNFAKGNGKVINKALKEGAKRYKKGLEENAPYEAGKGDHIRDNVKVSPVDDDGSIYIGFNKKVNWRAHFNEFGTIHQRPNNFIERTHETLQQEVFQIISAELKKGLGL